MDDLLGGWAIERALLNAFIDGVKPGKTILEFGSGSGTLELLKYFKVVSIEHDQEYVIQRSDMHKIYFAPLLDGWYDRKVVATVFDECEVNCILIDGPPNKDRVNLLHNLDLIKTFTGDLVFDDIERDEDYGMCIEVCEKLGYHIEILKGEHKFFGWCKKKR